jgi:hypothetical protein
MFGPNVKHETYGRVAVDQKAEDRPQFMRAYTIHLDGHFTVSVEIGYWSLGRREYSTLTQWSGKRISFELDAVADKIIDRDLYPRVQSAVDEIVALDEQFRKSRPSEFIDDAGVMWRRVE